MAYITREDGVHFVIPSYRDVLLAKKSAIQSEVMSLSQNYGEYITMQRKGQAQYEVAFSPDTGYLLGETVWHYFNRPLDMIYCEAIPNTTEAILVIVKGGSVYLDGSFPKDSIPEELVIFLTQQNNFEIYVYGDVPISEKAEEGKFSFEAASVRSFKKLDEPAFKNLPLIKAYNFQLVEIVIKEQGIGVFPVKEVVMGLVGIAIGWYLISTIFFGKKEEVAKVEVNPYQKYVDNMSTPAPDVIVAATVNMLKVLYSAPGWSMTTMLYKDSTVEALMRSNGTTVASLQQWAADKKFDFSVKPRGIVLTQNLTMQNRPKPKKIFKTNDVMAKFIDDLSKVYLGNAITLETPKKIGSSLSSKVTISLLEITPMVLSMIGDQMKGLPITITSITLRKTNETLSGSIDLEVYGN